MSAETQWKRSRVGASMSVTLPAQTETDSSMMFMAPKPAAPMQRRSSLLSASSSAVRRPGSKGWAR